MRSIVSIILFTFLAFGIGGCGSGSSEGTAIDPDKAVEITLPALSLSMTPSQIATFTFTKKYDSSVQVTLTNFKISISGCDLNQTFAPLALAMNGGVDSQASTLASGNLKAACSATQYVFTADMNVVFNGQTRMVSINKTGLVSGSGSSSSSSSSNSSASSSSVSPVQMSFYNVKDLNVTNTNTSYDIAFQLVDSNNQNAGIVGQTVQITAFDSTYGRLSNYEATSASGGWVTFSYLSPNSITGLANHTLTAVVTDGNQSLSTGITLRFNPASVQTGYRLSVVPADVNVTAPGDSHTVTVYLENNVTKQPVVGEQILLEYFDGTKGTMDAFNGTTNSNGAVSFTYTAPSAFTDGTEIPLNFKMQSNTSITTTSVMHLDTRNGVSYSGYSITLDPTSISITSESQSVEIDAYLQDENGQLVSGKILSVGFFNPSNGVMTNYSKTTDENGHAIFVYTGPASGIGVVQDINISMNEDGSIYKIVTASINISSTDYSAHALSVVPDDVNITAGGETQVVDVYLNDGNNRPAANENILVDHFDGNSGTMNSFKTATDANGHVAFNYTSPETFTNGTDVTLTFRLENNTSITATSVMHLDTRNGGSVSYTGYEIVVLPATINVAEGGEAVTLAAYLSDGSGDVVEGVGVKVNFFDPANGTLSAYNGTTDTNGQFTFTYTAPADLKNAAAFDINVTIADDSNGSRYAASHVTFPDIGSFNLRVIPEQFDVSDTTTPQTIDVYLENNATPAVGYTLRVGFFDQKNGTMDTYSGTTDTNGHVAFVYSSPSTLIGASSFEMNISMQADPSNYVTVDVNMTANDYSNYRIDADDNLTITAAGQAKEISVVLYTDNNGTLSPAVGKTVRAGFITPMYGKLAAYSATTDDSGTATFDYTAPDRIQNLSDFNLSFYFDENRSIRDDMNLSFDSTTESKVSYLYVVPSEVTITSAGEEKNITIVTVNANNVGVTSTVQIEQPIKDSTNYGTLSETLVTTDTNGVATVLYTAPDAISTLDERNLTVTEQSENITSRLSIQFKQSSDTNGTPYEIAVTTPDSLSIEDNDQITIVIHELDNANNVIEDDWVNEVNVTSLFSNVMTFADGNATRTYSGEGTKAYKVYTNTLAGVAVIEISASIFNGEINTTISEQITVSVLAGPVRAMSLNYIGSSTDENSSLFQNLYTLHAVDRYNNPAKEGVSISPTLINGWKVEKTNDIVTDRTGEINGTSPAKLTDNTVGFYTNGVQATVDRLIVLPNSINYDQNYTGGWSIETVDNNHTLSLADTYYGPDKSNLTYIIGNEKRLVRNAVHVADIKSKTTSYKTNSSGIVQFYATFDPILAAHTVTLAATAYENGIRTGVSHVDNLRWGHYGSSSQIVPSDNADHWVTLTLSIADENDNTLEPLVGLTVSAASIDSDVGDCNINTSAANDLTTDDNGNITFAVSTGLIPDSTIEQCTITWSKSNGSIYLEY